jgi:hypothetical protein
LTWICLKMRNSVLFTLDATSSHLFLFRPAFGAQPNPLSLDLIRWSSFRNSPPSSWARGSLHGCLMVAGHSENWAIHWSLSWRRLRISSAITPSALLRSLALWKRH